MKPLSEKAKTRILIAKDVLKYLDAKKISADHCYFQLDHSEKNLLEKPKSLKTLLSKAEDSCAVCAIGSMFYAYIKRFNKVKTNELIFNDDFIISADRLDITRSLGKFFSKDQLDEIEDYYECYDLESYNYDDESLMRDIMNNIISNKGKFVRPKEDIKEE